MEETEAALIAALLPGMNAGLQQRILDTPGSCADFLESPAGDVPKDLLAPWRAWRASTRRWRREAADLREHARRMSCSLICATDPAYPPLLREIHRPPPLLHVLGDPEILSLPQLAIVGSRNATSSGTRQAEQFAAALAEAGLVVTSGLALGIDAAAHRGALRSGRTLGVLGCGVDVVYPRRNRDLRQRILEDGGALVSELPPGSAPLRQHFPARNRIISGLAAGVLVVEAAPDSGSLITADFALEQGREVFAVPGSVHNPLSRGCHQLIREGALLTERVADIVDAIGGLLGYMAGDEPREPESPGPRGAEEPGQQAVLQALGFDPMDFDTLAARLDLPVPELSAALVALEMQGLVEQTGDRYQRCG